LVGPPKPTGYSIFNVLITLYLRPVWDTFDDHKRLMNDEVYPQVREKLGKCMGGEKEMRHVLFSDNTRIALTSPVTEIANLWLKDGVDKLEFENHMKSFIDHSLHAPLARDHQPFVFGETKESPGAYFFVGGWTTKQVRILTYMNSHELVGTIT
jgi:hypothetical protein